MTNHIKAIKVLDKKIRSLREQASCYCNDMHTLQLSYADTFTGPKREFLRCYLTDIVLSKQSYVTILCFKSDGNLYLGDQAPGLSTEHFDNLGKVILEDDHKYSIAIPTKNIEVLLEAIDRLLAARQVFKDRILKARDESNRTKLFFGFSEDSKDDKMQYLKEVFSNPLKKG